jgi:hypothetical protein
MRDLREEIATARSFNPVSSGYSRRSGNGKAVRAAGIVASQQRQRLFDLLSKVSLLSDRSARGCVSAAIFAGATQELGIALILLSAVLGAMLGSTIGFRVGDRHSEARFEERLAVIGLTVRLQSRLFSSWDRAKRCCVRTSTPPCCR